MEVVDGIEVVVLHVPRKRGEQHADVEEGVGDAWYRVGEVPKERPGLPGQPLR